MFRVIRTILEHSYHHFIQSIFKCNNLIHQTRFKKVKRPALFSLFKHSFHFHFKSKHNPLSKTSSTKVLFCARIQRVWSILPIFTWKDYYTHTHISSHQPQLYTHTLTHANPNTHTHFLYNQPTHTHIHPKTEQPITR